MARPRKVRFTSDDIIAMMSVVALLDPEVGPPGKVWTAESKAVIYKVKAIGPDDDISVVR